MERIFCRGTDCTNANVAKYFETDKKSEVLFDKKPHHTIFAATSKQKRLFLCLLLHN